MVTAEYLQGELERLFELESMMALSRELMGISPAELGGTETKGAFARALVTYCQTQDGLRALQDAIALTTRSERETVTGVYAIDEDAELPAETDVGDFRIVERLGKGPLGTVYLAERRAPDNGHTERAVVKVFTRRASRSRGAALRMLTTARAAAQVRDAGLANVLDAGRLPDERLFVVSDYVPGHTLAERLRRGPVHFDELRGVVRSLLHALDSLHGRGLIHGHIKAENIILARHEGAFENMDEPFDAESGVTMPVGRGVLTDIATIRLLEGSGEPLAGVFRFAGEPATLAPEVARGDARSERSDVYSLACVLYFALTGRPPFEGRTPVDVIAQHLSAVPRPPSELAPEGWVPPLLDQALLRALAKAPAERFPSALDFADALEGLSRSIFPAVPAEGLSDEALNAAIDHFAEDPVDPQRATELESLIAPSGEWQKLIDGYQAVAEASEEAAIKRQLWLRIARILAHELKDRKAAEEAYRHVLALAPGDAQAQAALEELLRRGGDYEGLVGLLLDRLETETAPETRAAILREVGGLYETRLGQPENALLAFSQALADDPDDDRAIRAVERLARTPEAWTESLETLTAAIDGHERPRAALSLCVISARFYETQLERADIALTLLNRALEIDPAYEPALQALSQLYRSARAFSELVQLLLHRANAAKTAAQGRDLKAEAAEVILQNFGDEERARQMLAEVFAADPAHPVAFHNLEAIYRKQGAQESLHDLLARRANNQRGGDRTKTLCQLGGLCEAQAKLQEAAQHYLDALEIDEKNRDAVEGLVRVHTASGDAAALLSALAMQLELAATPSQRAEVLAHMGEAEEARGHPAEAVVRYQQIIEMLPGHDFANSQLARLYRTLSRFEELAQTLDRHAKAVEDTDLKIDLLMQAARVLMVDLGSPERAAFMCERVLAIEPTHPEALGLIARMRTLAGDTASAIDALEVLADTEEVPGKKADLWVRAADLLEQREDFDGAVERYKLALDAVPSHEGALAALARLHDRRGDLHGKAEIMLRSAELASDVAVRAQRLAEVGRFRLAELNDRSLAAEAFERARELDPGNVEAQLGLGRLALARKDFAEAAALLEPLLERTSEMPLAAALEACIGAGDAYRALEQPGKAERAWLRGKALSNYNRDLLRRLSQLAVENGQHEEVSRLLGDLLDRHGVELDKKDRAQALVELGLAYQAQGMLGKALTALSSARELRPSWTRPLSALYQVHQARGEHEAAAEVLDQLLALAEDDAQRFQLLVEKGDLHAGPLKNQQTAATAYVTALELSATDRNVLAKLMTVYSEGKDWSRLCDVLVRLANVVEDPALKAKYLHTAAGIAADEIRDDERAVEYFERSLEHDPELGSAVEGLCAALTRLQSWTRLANVKRSHLDQVKAQRTPEQLANLWDELGELYERRLGRLDDAVEAYEQAHAAEPDNRARRERLARIYGSHPNHYAERAIAIHAELLAESPYHVDSYRALRKLYTQLKRPDEAWVVCQALHGLNMTEPEEGIFYRRHRSQEPATARECITEELWQDDILHPDQDRLVTNMLALIEPAAEAALAQPLEAFGTAPDRQLNCQAEPAVMAQMLYYASGVSLIPLPPVYYRPQDPAGVSFLFTTPPALGLGQAAFQQAPDQALAFIAGRQLSYFRPGHFMRQLVPTGSGLRSWLLAAIRLVNPRFPIPEPMRPQVDQNVAALEATLAGPKRQALSSFVDRLLREEAELDMRRWARGVDLTADRLGFILANGLDAAVALVRASPQESSFASERERVKELYRYSVSPQYIALRKSIGIAIA